MKNKEEQGFRFILDAIIKLLGGYTKQEFKDYKKTIHCTRKEMDLMKDLADDEKQMLHQYREDKIYHKGKAKIHMKRINK